MSHGLDAESAVERLATARKCEEETPPTYPFNVLATSYEMIDHAFREAFSDQTQSLSPELYRQAQETARQVMGELLSGTQLLQLSPDALRAIETALREVTQHVTHEAVKLEQQVLPTCKGQKPKTLTQDLRRHIREQISTSQPVKQFKERYLGFTAALEEERSRATDKGKATQ